MSQGFLAHLTSDLEPACRGAGAPAGPACSSRTQRTGASNIIAMEELAEKTNGSKLHLSSVLGLVAALFLASLLHAQDLAPRAYLITPLHYNAVTLTYSFFKGSIEFNNALAVTGAEGRYNVPVFAYYHSFNFLGRSATSWQRCPMHSDISRERWLEWSTSRPLRPL